MDIQVLPSPLKTKPGLQIHRPFGPTLPLAGQFDAVGMHAVLSPLNWRPGLQTHSLFLATELAGQGVQAGSPVVLNIVFPWQTQLLPLTWDPPGQVLQILLIRPKPRIQPHRPSFFNSALTPHWLIQAGPTLMNPNTQSQTPVAGLYC